MRRAANQTRWNEEIRKEQSYLLKDTQVDYLIVSHIFQVLLLQPISSLDWRGIIQVARRLRFDFILSLWLDLGLVVLE